MSSELGWNRALYRVVMGSRAQLPGSGGLSQVQFRVNLRGALEQALGFSTAVSSSRKWT